MRIAQLKTEATRWLESESLLKQMFSFHPEKNPSLKIDQVLNTGHRRKLLVSIDDSKFVCHVNLDKRFSKSLTGLHDLVQKHGVPIATVLNSGTLWNRLIPIHFLVLDWVPGTVCDQKVKLTLSDLADLGRLFAQLHSISSSEWNVDEITYPTRFESYEAMQNGWMNRIEKLLSLDETNNEKAFDTYCEWIRSEGNFMNAILDQHVVHGDVHGNNVLIHEGRFALIDTDSMRFSFSLLEMVRCLLSSYNQSILERQLAFLSGYKEAIDSNLWQIWEKHLKYISAIGFMEKARTQFIKSQKEKSKDKKSRQYKMAVTYWNTFKRLMAAHTSEIRNWESVSQLFQESRV